jgi:hypothetical protein
LEMTASDNKCKGTHKPGSVLPGIRPIKQGQKWLLTLI